VNVAATSEDESQQPEQEPEAALHPAQRWGALYGLCYDAGRWLCIYQRLDGVWYVAAIYGTRADAEDMLDGIGRTERRQRRGRLPARPTLPALIPMAGQLTIDDALEGKL
jgi:hypothetical protein